MELQISGISGKEKKIAYLNFEDDTKSAEFRIPDCTVLSNHGFTEDELQQLTQYVQANKEEFLKQAKQINPMKAFLKK